MASKAGIVFEIQKYSTEDGPGIRTTVFFKGCPLKCTWCQNPEGIGNEPSLQWFAKKCIGCGTCVKACEKKAVNLDENGVHVDRTRCDACGTCVKECPGTALKMFGTPWMLDDLVSEVEKDFAYYAKSGGGVTASGGDPILQADFVARFLQKCKDVGISTAIETCGLASRAVFEKILPHVDLIMYDLKEIDPDKHEHFTGARNDLVLENCIWLTAELSSKGKKIWIRTPIIPGYTATDENIKGIATFIITRLHNKIDRWDMLAFNNLPADKYDRMDRGPWALKNHQVLTKKEMEHFYTIAVDAGVNNVHWSGITRDNYTA
nr:glycyl-radical enzyme activating protein [Candidatus Sigynarchaeota archaeon]